MEMWAESHMWPFSCYSYKREGNCIPRLTDTSPEEVRWMAYRGLKEAGGEAAYQTELRKIHEHTMSVRRELMNISTSNVQNLVRFSKPSFYQDNRGSGGIYWD